MRSGYYFSEEAQEWAHDNMQGEVYVTGETLDSTPGNKRMEVFFTNLG